MTLVLRGVALTCTIMMRSSSISAALMMDVIAVNHCGILRCIASGFGVWIRVSGFGSRAQTPRVRKIFHFAFAGVLDVDERLLNTKLHLSRRLPKSEPLIPQHELRFPKPESVFRNIHTHMCSGRLDLCSASASASNGLGRGGGARDPMVACWGRVDARR